LDKEILKTKAVVYKVLGRLFLERPNRELIEQILKEKLFEDFPIEAKNPLFKNGTSLLKTWSEEHQKDDPALIAANLAQDFDRLFVGPDHLLAPPWESVYLSQEKLMFGEETLAVRTFYARHGLQFVRKNKEPDDHLGLELIFLGELNTRASEAVDKKEEKEAEYLQKEAKDFIQEHLLRWLPALRQDIQQNAKSRYFKGLIDVVYGLLEDELALEN